MTNAVFVITKLFCVLYQLAFLLAEWLLVCLMELSKSIISGVPQVH